MDQSRRDAARQANLSTGLTRSPAAPDSDLEPVGSLEIADEMLDAFLLDDDLEPLPEPADFWLE